LDRRLIIEGETFDPSWCSLVAPGSAPHIEEKMLMSPQSVVMPSKRDLVDDPYKWLLRYHSPSEGDNHYHENELRNQQNLWRNGKV